MKPTKNEQSDELLCCEAMEGNREAEECLVLRYNRLVRICARPYFLAGGASEDLIQEGMIGLISAIRGFRHTQDVIFRTYAEICIQNRIRSAVRAAARDKHAPLNYSVVIEPTLVEGKNNPEDILIDREEWEKRKLALQNNLSGFEGVVLRLYLAGLSYAEIASQTEKEIKSVDNAIQRIRRKAAPYFTSGDISVS